MTTPRERAERVIAVAQETMPVDAKTRLVGDRWAADAIAAIYGLLSELDRVASLVGVHDPTGADHMADAARACEQRDRLEAAIRQHHFDHSRQPDSQATDADLRLWATFAETETP